jgi:hypothetical protein
MKPLFTGFHRLFISLRHHLVTGMAQEIMMPEAEMSIVERALASLTREFGSPLCRGDCCWWTLSRAGQKPVRLSVFIDGDGAQVEGWLCDLQVPSVIIERFSFTDVRELESLVERITSLLAPHAGAPRQDVERTSQQAEPPLTRHV